MTARRIAVAALAIVASAVAFVLTFFHVGWHRGPTLAPRVTLDEIGAALSGLRAGWFALFLALNACSLPLRALQLRAVARRSDGSAPPYAPCLRAIVVGVLASNLLPARLGEAARALVLTRDGAVSLPRSASALLVGRALDLVALLAMCFALPVALGLPAAQIPALHAVASGGAVLGAIVVALIVALWLTRRSAARALGRLSVAVGRAAAEFLDGLASVADLSRLGIAAPASLAVPLSLAASFACAFRAVGIAPPAGASLVLTGISLLGVAVPSAPSALGVYHAVVAATLIALGVDPPKALGFALCTHAAATAMNLGLGAIALASSRASSPSDGAGARSVDGAS